MMLLRSESPTWGFILRHNLAEMFVGKNSLGTEKGVVQLGYSL